MSENFQKDPPDWQKIPDFHMESKSKFNLSYFLLMFILGFWFYPLIIPWFLMIVPKDWARFYMETYADYIFFVMKILGI